MGFKFNVFTGKFDIDTDTVSSTTSTTISVYNNATSVVASISSIDFNSYFSVTSATTGRANIALNVGAISIASSQINDLAIFKTVLADVGSTTANTATDSLTVAGGNGIKTSITGDVLTPYLATLTSTWAAGGAIQSITQLDVDNIRLDGNAISVTQVFGNLQIAAASSARIQMQSQIDVIAATTTALNIGSGTVNVNPTIRIVGSSENQDILYHETSSSLQFIHNGITIASTIYDGTTAVFKTERILRIANIAGDSTTNTSGDIWYNATTNKFRKNENGTVSNLDTTDTETVQDIVGSMSTAGSSKITVTYNDTDGTLAIDAVESAINHNALLNYTTTQHFTIPQISITSSQVSDLTETVEDIVSGEITVGSSKLTGTYNDTDGTYSLDLGTVNLDHLADVSIASAATGQMLVFTTTGWVNSSIGSGISGPLSSTANAMAYFNTTTGNTLAASSVAMITSTGIYFNTTGARLFFLTSTHYLYAESTTSIVLNSANTLTVSGQSTTIVGVAGNDVQIGDGATEISLVPGANLKCNLGTTLLNWNDIFCGGTAKFSGGGTAQSPINIVNASDPTTPATDDFWNGSSQKALIAYINGGIKHYYPAILYTSSSNNTVTNTTTETTLLGTGVGTLTLPASFLVAGKTIKFRAWGVYSTEAVPITLNIRFKLDTSTIATTGAVTTAASLSNRFWMVEVVMTCRTTGAAGSVFTQGYFLHQDNVTSTAQPSMWPMSNSSTNNVDTTAAHTIDLTAQWGAGADASDSIVCSNATVEVLA